TEVPILTADPEAGRVEAPSHDCLSAVLGVVRQRDQAPVRFLAPVIQVFPPLHADEWLGSLCACSRVQERFQCAPVIRAAFALAIEHIGLTVIRVAEQNRVRVRHSSEPCHEGLSPACSVMKSSRRCCPLYVVRMTSTNW